MGNKGLLHNLSLSELRQELDAREQELYRGKSKSKISSPLEPRKDLEKYRTMEIVNAVRSHEKVIYGVDDRVDIFELKNDEIRSIADSVVALFGANRIRDNGDGTSTLRTEEFLINLSGQDIKPCQTEKFRNQPVGAFCSGFLVAPNVIATAGHCLNAGNFHTVKFVFDYRMENKNNINLSIENKNIYNAIGIIDWVLDRNGPDWALVELDREVKGREPLTLRTQGKITLNDELFVIGHPMGLPQKYADQAKVTDNDPKDYFTANLDTYGGNSGSAIVNKETLEVEGILVRGQTDFVLASRSSNCAVSLIIPAGSDKGEDVTRIENIVSSLRKYTN